MVGFEVGGSNKRRSFIRKFHQFLFPGCRPTGGEPDEGLGFFALDNLIEKLDLAGCRLCLEKLTAEEVGQRGDQKQAGQVDEGGVVKVKSEAEAKKEGQKQADDDGGNRLEEKADGKEEEVEEKENRRLDAAGGEDQEENEDSKDDGVEGGREGRFRTADELAGEVKEEQKADGLQ